MPHSLFGNSMHAGLELNNTKPRQELHRHVWVICYVYVYPTQYAAALSSKWSLRHVLRCVNMVTDLLFFRVQHTETNCLRMNIIFLYCYSCSLFPNTVSLSLSSIFLLSGPSSSLHVSCCCVNKVKVKGWDSSTPSTNMQGHCFLCQHCGKQKLTQISHCSMCTTVRQMKGIKSKKQGKWAWRMVGSKIPHFINMSTSFIIGNNKNITKILLHCCCFFPQLGISLRKQSQLESLLLSFLGALNQVIQSSSVDGA